MAEYTQNALIKVMEREPWLCDWGLANKALCMINNIDLASSRESLEHRTKKFGICCEWLKLCKAIKTVNCGIPGSYHLKHLVERWAGTYVSNGSFIAAVIYLGIPYKFYEYTVNIHIGISSRSETLEAYSRREL
jgi:hypothetical protein